MSSGKGSFQTLEEDKGHECNQGVSLVLWRAQVMKCGSKSEAIAGCCVLTGIWSGDMGEHEHSKTVVV